MADLDFVVKNGLVVNTSFTANSSQVALGANVLVNTSTISVGNSTVNNRITSTNITVGNSSVNVSINSTSFSGTANNTLFVGTVTAANVVSNAQLSANLSNYQTTAGLSANVATLTANNTSFVGSVTAANVVSNAQLSANLANYVTATNLSNNLANYQTTAGLAGNVATLTANNSSFIGTVSAANVVSNAQLQANLGNYQTSAGLTANVAVRTANNSTNFGGQLPAFYTNATNITTGTLPYAQIPANVINTTGTFTRTGDTTFNNITTFNANVTVGSIGLSSNGSFGTAGQVLHSNGTATYWATDDQGVTSVATGNGMTGGAITTTGTVSILANNGVVANSTGLFVSPGTGVVVNATGVHVNSTYIGTLTAANTSFVGSVSAANVVSNAQLTDNLARYATLTGATFSGPVAINANVTVTGNLTVTGSLVSMNVTTLDVTDKNITVAKGAASAAATDGAGLFVDVSGVSMRYTFSSNTWEYNVGLIPSANNSWDLGLTGLRWKTVFANTVDAINISGNGTSITSVNAATVGGNTAATLRSYSDSIAATAYSNAVSAAATDASTKAATAYSNAVNVLAPKESPAFTGTVSLGSNVSINTSAVFVGNSTVNSYVTSSGLYVNGQVFQSGGGYYKGNQGTVGNTNNAGNLFRINANTQSNNITVSAGENALATGPIAIGSGFTFTIETNGRAVII